MERERDASNRSQTGVGTASPAAGIGAPGNLKARDTARLVARVHRSVADRCEMLRSGSGLWSASRCISLPPRDVQLFARSARSFERAVAAAHSANTTRPVTQIECRFVGITLSP